MPTPRTRRQPQKPRLPVMQGLELWFSADRIPDVRDGVGVPVWPDLSPNKRDASQTDSTRWPIWKENIVNGKAVLRFDSTDRLDIPAFDLGFTKAITIFAVFSAPSAADRIVFEFSTNVNSFTDGFLFYRDTSNKLVAITKGDIGYSYFISTGTISTTPAVATGIIDKSLATDEATNWINGTSTGTHTNANNTNNFGNRAATIGSRIDTTLPLAGDIATIILYSRALSTAERILMETYLS